MVDKEVLEQWYQRYLANDLSEEELGYFLAALHEQRNEQIVSALMDTTWQEMYQDIPERTIPMRKNRIIRFLAAASVIAAIGIGAYFLVFNQHQDEIPPRQEITLDQPDIQPGGDRAILTLADGRQIVLDSAGDGSLVQQGGVKVIKIGGQLSYDREGASSSEVLYNTITTPRGGQYELELVDGSRVWLNAASSLRYPTAFKGKYREVELTGEGYFEVAQNAGMPFRVKAGKIEVQVLGTHFNINCYSDEPSVKTTLLEGRVLVEKGGEQVALRPGQQAIVQPQKEGIRLTDEVDLEEVVAWKNGHFLFNNTDIETVMRQIARWYDVEVDLEKRSSRKISGGLPRSENILQLVKILEATGNVNFEIKGKQIIVKPK